jgi:hypothetical protein
VPLVTTERITALAHCAQLTEPGIRCPGYAQAEVPGIRETTAFTFRDGWGGLGPSDAFDQALAELTERSVIRVRFADEADAACPHCGVRREVTDQRRPQYQRLSEVEPDELLRRQRVTETAAVQTASAAERQAVALEALAQQGTQAGEVEQLREVVAEQGRQIDRLLAQLQTEAANGEAAPKRRAVKASG